jgi:uncharacterized Rossmann fold enzyme
LSPDGGFLRAGAEKAINTNLHALDFVKFVDWFPYYQSIRSEFGYSTEKDQEAARTLSGMIKRKALDTKVLEKKIKGKNVFVVGAGPGLDDNGIKLLKKNTSFVKVAADGAVAALLENKIKPDIVVTDLDGSRPRRQHGHAEKISSQIQKGAGDDAGDAP